MIDLVVVRSWMVDGDARMPRCLMGTCHLAHIASMPHAMIEVDAKSKIDAASCDASDATRR
jgi:hypothetical protein